MEKKTPRQKANKFIESFIISFNKELDMINDARLALINLHIYLERMIDVFIECWFANPKYIPLYGFKKRLDLIRAIGIFNNQPQLWTNMLNINTARNEYAHGFNINTSKVDQCLNNCVIDKDIRSLSQFAKIKEIGNHVLVTFNQVAYTLLAERSRLLKRGLNYKK